MLALNPLSAQVILDNYKIPGFTPQYALVSKAAALVALLNKVDPNWRTIERDEEQISYLFAMHNMSDDARTVLSEIPEYRDLMVVAEWYGPESFSKSMRDKYPMCPILT